jgi:hypothetical protein
VADFAYGVLQVDVVVRESVEAAAVLDFEAAQFGARYGETPQTLAVSFEPFVSSMVFVRVRDERGTVVGMARIIGPSAAGLPAVHDLALPVWGLDPREVVAVAGFDPQSTWEIATITALPGPAAQACWHGVLRLLRVNRVSVVVAMLDDRVKAIVNSHMQMRVTPMPGAFSGPYYGSPATTAVYAEVEAVLARQRLVARPIWDLVTAGIGLPIRAVTDDQFRVPDSIIGLARDARLG